MECRFCRVEDVEPIKVAVYPISGMQTENEDSSINTLIVVDDGDLFVDIAINENSVLQERAKIKYCPMCGRELNQTE